MERILQFYKALTGMSALQSSQFLNFCQFDREHVTTPIFSFVCLYVYVSLGGGAGYLLLQNVCSRPLPTICLDDCVLCFFPDWYLPVLYVLRILQDCNFPPVCHLPFNLGSCFKNSNEEELVSASFLRWTWSCHWKPLHWQESDVFYVLNLSIDYWPPTTYNH